MRFILGVILGGIIGFGFALWFQGEPPFSGGLSGSRGDISITLSDEYLTRVAGPVISKRSNGLLTGVRVASTTGDTAYVRSSAHVAGTVIPAGVSLSLTVTGGSLGLDVRSAHMGPVPVPAVVISPLLSAINSQVSSLVTNSGFVIVGAGTTETSVQIFLRRA